MKSTPIPKVMEFFPRRRTRAESDALYGRGRDAIATTGLVSFALALRDTR
jgi:hypothetical protein